MVKNGHVTGIELDFDSKPEFCEVCIRAKAPRKPFPKESTSDKPQVYGEKVTGDVWGPASTKSLGGSKWFSLYQDKYSHEEKAYFFKNKSDTFKSYKEYEAWVKVQRGVTEIKTFGCDRGGEFTSDEF